MKDLKQDPNIQKLLNAQKITEEKLKTLINSQPPYKILLAINNDILLDLVLHDFINIDQAINIADLNFNETQTAILKNVTIRNYLKQGWITLKEAITSARNNSVTTFTDQDLTYIQDYISQKGAESTEDSITPQIALQLGDNERKILRLPTIKDFIQSKKITINEAIDNLVNQPWITFSNKKILQFVVGNDTDISSTNKENKITAKDAFKLNEDQRNCLSNDLVIKLINDNKNTIFIPRDRHNRVRAYTYEEQINGSILDYEEPQSNISLQSTLTATFLAAKDTKKLLGYDSKISEENNKKLQLQALDNFIKGLYNMQRGYNMDQDDSIDNNKKSLPICIAGCFNECINTLNGIHQDCTVNVVNPATVNGKFEGLVKETMFFHLARLYLLEKKNLEHLELIRKAPPDEMLNEIQKTVSKELREYFSGHIEIDKIRKAIEDAIPQIEYVEINKFDPEEINLEILIKILQTVTPPKERVNLIKSDNQITQLCLKFIENKEDKEDKEDKEKNFKDFLEKLFKDQSGFVLSQKDTDALKKLLITPLNMVAQQPINIPPNAITEENKEEEELLAYLVDMINIGYNQPDILTAAGRRSRHVEDRMLRRADRMRNRHPIVSNTGNTPITPTEQQSATINFPTPDIVDGSSSPTTTTLNLPNSTTTFNSRRRT